MTQKILVVDDDAAVLGLLCKIVKNIGYDAVPVNSGEDALLILSESEYALVLLDINMNGIDGFTVLERMRKNKINIPVIIISARKEDFDTVYGLDIGADDYVTKPFNPVTLGAKIKAVIRRSNSSSSNDGGILNVGPFSYNTSTLRFFKNNSEIVLSGKENAIMKLFMDNVGRIFSKDMIYDLVWGSEIVDDNAVMVYIRYLRKKIEDDPDRPRFIQNIRGIGYRFSV